FPYFLFAAATTLVKAKPFADAPISLLQLGGDVFQLTRGVELGQYFQCDYFHDYGNGSSTGTYCFYRTSDYGLTHYPNTPLRVDSNPVCPDPMPNAPDAGQFILKVPSSDPGPGNCATILGASEGTAGNGSTVGIKLCDGRHNYFGQKWTFDGYNIRQGNLCLDVTNGSNTNGAKLQVWTCFPENTNQRWSHVGGDLLYFPR
ncbi:hypothetical protein DL96DRAFT_1229413, partial [Flagelloscypha sp. PMI_526]